MLRWRPTNWSVAPKARFPSTDVGGTPRQPAIELSSVPALPEDEILSRMLFGRSSVDLSALEAAELAGTLARFAGRDTGLNPITAKSDAVYVIRGIDTMAQKPATVYQLNAKSPSAFALETKNAQCIFSASNYEACV